MHSSKRLPLNWSLQHLDYFLVDLLVCFGSVRSAQAARQMAWYGLIFVSKNPGMQENSSLYKRLQVLWLPNKPKSLPLHHHNAWLLVWGACCDTLCLVFSWHCARTNISTFVSSLQGIVFQNFVFKGCAAVVLERRAFS